MISTWTLAIASLFGALFAITWLVTKRYAPGAAWPRPFLSCVAVFGLLFTVVNEADERAKQPASAEQLAALGGCERDAARETVRIDRMISRAGLDRIKEWCAQQAQDQAQLEARKAEERAVVAAQRAALDGAGAAPRIR